jgi:hypothetical protein
MERLASQVLLRRAMRAVAVVLIVHLAFVCQFAEAQARKQAPRPKAAAPARVQHPKEPCTSLDDVRDLPGTWDAEFQHETESSDIMSKPDLARALKEMTVYAELVHAAFRVEGHSVVWYRSVGGRLFTNGPAQYQINVLTFNYDCEDGFVARRSEHKFQRNWGSDESAAIAVNSTWHMSGAGAGSVIGGKKYYAFGSPIGEIRGFPAYQIDGGWVVLVSKPGKNPFHFATRQEVLESMRAMAQAQRQKALDTVDAAIPVRSPEEQKAAHDKGLADWLAFVGAKDEAQRQHRIERYEHDYRTDEQKREELRAKMTKDTDKVIAHFDALIAQQTPEQLNMTAMSHPSAIMHAWEDFKFLPTHEEKCGKGDCSGEFGVPFGIPARSYYNPDLPPGRPQFFCVVFNWTAGNPKEAQRMEKIRDDFFAKFDFDKLVSMLEN